MIEIEHEDGSLGAVEPDDDAAETGAGEAEIGVHTFVAGDADAGVRLDRFLAAHLEGWSRARLQNLIESDAALVGGQAAKSSLKLRAGDQVEIELSEAPVSEFAPEDAPVEIVYEDDVLAVVDKPAGLVVHPGAGRARGTLANRLAFHFNRLSAAGGAARPGIVHRLDRDTSGLLVVAKSEAAHENLSAQFRLRHVSKRYQTLVFGRLHEHGATIQEPIGRDPGRRTRMAVIPEGRGGRAAFTRYRMRAEFRASSLLDVEIKTGRTHQIRVHLAHIKHPVVGDETYAGNRINNVADPRERSILATAPRQFLHAAHLGFTHPRNNEFMRFDAPLPADLAGLLERLRALSPPPETGDADDED